MQHKNRPALDLDGIDVDTPEGCEEIERRVILALAGMTITPESARLLYYWAKERREKLEATSGSKPCR